MINVLAYSNSGDPIYIAVSNEPLFHVVYQGQSVSSHNSLGSAVASAAYEFSIENSIGFFGWQPIQ